MKVAAIIPALNEEATVGEVVAAVRRTALIDQVVVVSDGSEDGTAAVARAAGATVVEHSDNLGKAAAMVSGLKLTDAELLLFLDADLVGLRPEHVTALVRPVLVGEADMTVGLFDDGRLATDLAQLIAPYLSGQRAVRRLVLEDVFRTEPDIEISRYGVEVVLTRHVKRLGLTVQEVSLEQLTQRTKEEKLGLMRGLAARMRMYWDILKYAQRG